MVVGKNPRWRLVGMQGLFIEGNLNQQETLETKEATEIIMLGYRELLETKDHRKKGKRNR